MTDRIETHASLETFFGGYVEGTEDLPRPKILLADLPPLPPPAAERGRLDTVAAFLQATFD